MWEKEGTFATVSEVVQAHTNKTEQELLNDTKEYFVKNITEAANMIKEAMNKQQKIFIAGDYDVDGICASSNLFLAFKAMKYDSKVTVRLPKRFSEGYGLSEKMVDEFEANSLLITVDNGITAGAAIQKAKDKGMTVILTDHHLPAENGVLPNADIIIDANAGTEADFHGYCGAGIAYKLAITLLGKDHYLIPKLTSLTAIATVADVVPLIEENRRIVKDGLKTMTTKEGTTMGLFALLCQYELNNYVNSTNIGFKIAPTLNAPGRLSDNGAIESFRLMTFEGPFNEAMKMAEKLVEYNENRRSISEEWNIKAREQIATNRMEADFPMFVYLKGIPEGIVGIIAGQLAEAYRTPCFVMTDGEDGLKGSGRTFGGVNLKNLLDNNAEFFTRYGGHAEACGFALPLSNLYLVREKMNEECKDIPRTNQEKIKADLVIKADEIQETIKEVIKFEPYGEGNPSPIIAIEDVSLTPNGSDYYKLLAGGKAIKLLANNLELIGFNCADKYTQYNNPRHISPIGTFSLNHFRGVFKNQMEIIDIEKVEIKKTETKLQKLLNAKAAGRR